MLLAWVAPLEILIFIGFVHAILNIFIFIFFMTKYGVTWKITVRIWKNFSGTKLTHIATFSWVAKGYSMGSLSNVSRNFQSFYKFTIMSLQIVIKCQHLINISYFYVYRHVEKLLLFIINTTCNCQYWIVFSTDFWIQGGKIARNLPEILGTGEHVFIKCWGLMG